MVTVYISEEYGYRHWEWNTNLPEVKLIAWWTNLETVETFFFDPGTLPFGKMNEIYIEDFPKGTDYTMHLHTDGDSHLSIRGKAYHHKGFDPNYFFREDKEQPENKGDNDGST